MSKKAEVFPQISKPVTQMLGCIILDLTVIPRKYNQEHMKRTGCFKLEHRFLACMKHYGPCSNPFLPLTEWLPKINIIKYDKTASSRFQPSSNVTKQTQPLNHETANEKKKSLGLTQGTSQITYNFPAGPKPAKPHCPKTAKVTTRTFPLKILQQQHVQC